MVDLRRLLEPRSIAVVGASERGGSFGNRMTTELLRSPSAPQVHLVHPKYPTVHGRPCMPSLLDVDQPVDLVVLGVPDAALAPQLRQAAQRGDSAAVIFGTAHGYGDELTSIATHADVAICGAGSMGYLNIVRGVRTIGYVERFPLTPGGIAFITHSGSVFSALLRTHRRLEFSVIVSSGQELVTPMAAYLDYALTLPETRVVGLFTETLRNAEAMQAALARAAEQDVPVVALTAGGSPTGARLVTAHSGAIAGDDAAWEALFSAYGVHRVGSLDEMVDTLELFAVGRRVRPGTTGALASVHDSGGERALLADAAEALGVTFADLSEPTRERLARLLDVGLEATNPLDVWGRGADTETLLTESLQALVDDPAVAVAAVGLDLVEEYDGDQSYPRAVRTVHAGTDKPVVVLSNVAAALDQRQAIQLRAADVPVLEGTHSGLRALRHLLDQAAPKSLRPTPVVNEIRAARWRGRLAAGELGAVASMALLRDYGVRCAVTLEVTTTAEALLAASEVGYPVVLKTASLEVLHKTDVGGVHTGLMDAPAVTAAFAELEGRFGDPVVVQPHLPGAEVALGIVRDPLLGALVLVAPGGTLVEVLQERLVGLPPLSEQSAAEMVAGLPRLTAILRGVRGGEQADVGALTEAIVATGQLAVELGDHLEALDINPLMCAPDGVVAVDALVVRRAG